MRDGEGGPRPSLPELGAPEPTLTREQRRSRRVREVRARTISAVRMTKRELAAGRALYPPDDDGSYGDPPRPKTRAECLAGLRPCPFVSCAHHLYLDVSEQTGAIKLNFPDLEPDELAETCALDVADQGGATLERVAQLFNVTRERVRQIESKALGRPALARALRSHADETPDRRVRRLPIVDDDEGGA